MTYIEINTIAEKCEHMYDNMCKKRNKLRDCFRSVCCGYCPTNDSCVGICTPVKEAMVKSNG